MATVGSILANVRIQVGDPNLDFLTDTIGMEWMSQAEQRFADNILALDEIKDYVIVGNQLRYDLPTNCILPLSVTYYQNITRILDYVDPSFWDSLLEGTPFGQGTPDYWTIQRQQVLMGPDAPLSNSATSTASGTFTIAATTFGLTVASGTFRSRGFALCESEVFEYNAVATTTLTGCTRGVHGTSAASHASNTVVTQIDAQLRYRKMPLEITATTQTPQVPAIYQKYLEKYVMYLYFLANGNIQKAEVLYNEFEVLEKSAQTSIARRALARHQIRDKRTMFRGW